MHPNPAYRDVPEAISMDFVRDRGFGTSVLNGDPVPMCSHIPFWNSLDGKTLEAHLVRSNPLAQQLTAKGRPALIAVNGADSYVPPDWYQSDDQVSTWNYVAVHLQGYLKLADPDQLRAYLERLSHEFETRLAPKPEWKIDKVSDDVLARLFRMILPVEFTISGVRSTWKLAQNKDEAMRLTAADHVMQSRIGTEITQLAALMRNPPKTIA